MASSLVGSKGIGMLGDAAKLGKGLGKGLTKLTNAAVKAGMIDEDVVKVKPIVDELGLIGMSTFNTTTEAAFESMDTRNQVRVQQSRKLFGKEYHQLNPAEKIQVDTLAGNAAAKTFKNNLVALLPSNYITNSFFFKPFEASKGRLSTLFKDGKLIEDVKPLTIGEKALAVGKEVGKSGLIS